MANRLKNAPSSAARLSGKDIGSIDSTVSAPKTRPQTFAKANRDIFASLECLMPKTIRFLHLGRSWSHLGKGGLAFDSGRKNAAYSELLKFARAGQRASWFRPGMLAVFQNLHAVDENVLHPNRVLVRFLESRPVRNCRGVKDNHVGEHPVLNETAVVEA